MKWIFATTDRDIRPPDGWDQAAAKAMCATTGLDLPEANSWDELGEIGIHTSKGSPVKREFWLANHYDGRIDRWVSDLDERNNTFVSNYGLKAQPKHHDETCVKIVNEKGSIKLVSLGCKQKVKWVACTSLDREVRDDPRSSSYKPRS